MLGFLRNIYYIYNMRVRQLQLISLILVLIYTHNECRLRVTAIELEPIPLIEYFQKPL
jgi:hypothetical protein